MLLCFLYYCDLLLLSSLCSLVSVQMDKKGPRSVAGSVEKAQQKPKRREEDGDSDDMDEDDEDDDDSNDDGSDDVDGEHDNDEVDDEGDEAGKESGSRHKHSPFLQPKHADAYFLIESSSVMYRTRARYELQLQ